MRSTKQGIAVLWVLAALSSACGGASVAAREGSLDADGTQQTTDSISWDCGDRQAWTPC